MIRLLSKLRTVLAIAGAFVLSLLATAITYRRKGAKEAKKEIQSLELRKDRDANRRMNDADTGVGDPADDLAWLRERGKHKSKRRP